ncbi:MAG: ABC transporter permease [Alistipes sp.]|nr:ABC transporter permease [Alistipes sp.]
MRKIGLIIEREFSERVRKKSFIITTLLMPILMIGMMLAPSLVMLYSGTELREIVVVDKSGTIAPRLSSSEEVLFIAQNDLSKEEACSTYNAESSISAVLYIAADVATTGDVQLITNTPSSPVLNDLIASQIESIIERDKLLERYDIADLDTMLRDVETEITINTFENNGTGDEESMEAISSEINYILGLLFGVLLYMIIILYGQMVLTSVVEEKASRVLDVMVTSCSPFELMMGKILGIASVALTQIAIWALLILGASRFLVPTLFSSDVVAANDIMMEGIVGTLGDVGYMSSLILYLALYILGGFLLYASLYAAAGSAVDSVQDGQQFNTVIMAPIMLSLFAMMAVVNDPNSPIVVWASIIPLTSPIVMMARIPFGIAGWEIALSLTLLYLSFVFTTWLAAKIYRIGIFMHGKRPSWRELASWLRIK